MVEALERPTAETYHSFRLHLYDIYRGGLVQFFVFKFHNLRKLIICCAKLYKGKNYPNRMFF